MAFIDEQEYDKPFSLSLWLKLTPFTKPYKKEFFLIMFLMMLSAILDASIPLFQKYALDQFIQNKTMEGIFTFGSVYLGIIIFQIGIILLFSIKTMYVDLCVSRDMKRSCFIKLQELSFTYYNTTPVGYTHTRIMSDTLKISATVSWTLVDIVWQGFYVGSVFVAMFLLNAKLALIVATVIPVLALLTAFFQKKILLYNRKARKVNSQITNAYNEGITGQKTLKTLVLEEPTYEAFQVHTKNMRVASVKSSITSAIYIPLVLFISSIVMALVLSNGTSMAMESLIPIGTLSVFISYAISIFEPIQQMAKIFAEFISTGANIERVIDLLDQESDIMDTPFVIERYGTVFEPKKENWEPLLGDIEFKNVWFQYPDGHEYILEDFSLKIPAGTTVAIVGETGAGKSTLVNLICRFFEPTKGEILIDGINYKERSSLWLHSNIGYVLQNPHLFSGTIKENIQYGNLNATDEEIHAAACSVSANLAIDKLEDGYNSTVYESGDSLSTGEKQLISFARAVLTDPRIFVLDEATSSIDTYTESLIQKAISHLLQDRTSFIIAHRLSTIQQADVILVVRDGKIIEQGSHQELLEENGYYFHLYKNQFDEESTEQLFHTTN
ncbi:MAG: ABC transporter ATP-binding protein [Eubacteriales bacterium]